MDFILLALRGAVGVAKRSTHGNKKLSFDYAIRCIIDEMKRRNRYDLYMAARRIYFISQQRKSVKDVVEYFGYTWSDVVSRETKPPTSNTGVTVQRSEQFIQESIEGYV